MLIPSEQLFASLNTDFADLVQESRTAGLWMMSPATLTATLQALYAAMDGAQGAAGSGELLEEIIALRERVSSLEKDPASPQAALWDNGAKPAKSSTGDQKTAEDAKPHAAQKRPLSPEEEAFEKLEREETLADTGEKNLADKGDRPPFPLR